MWCCLSHRPWLGVAAPSIPLFVYVCRTLRFASTEKLVDTKRVELFTDALQVRLAPTEHVCPKMVRMVSLYE